MAEKLTAAVVEKYLMAGGRAELQEALKFADKETAQRLLEKIQKMGLEWEGNPYPMKDLDVKAVAAAQKAVPPGARVSPAHLSRSALAGLKPKNLSTGGENAVEKVQELQKKAEKATTRGGRGGRRPPVTTGPRESVEAKAARFKAAEGRLADRAVVPEHYLEKEQRKLKQRMVEEARKKSGVNLAARRQAEAPGATALQDQLLAEKSVETTKAQNEATRKLNQLRKSARAAKKERLGGVSGKLRELKLRTKAVGRYGLGGAGKGLGKGMGGLGGAGLMLALMLGPSAFDWIKGRVKPESDPDFKTAEELYGQLRSQSMDRKRQEGMQRKDPELYQTVLNMLAGVPPLSGQLDSEITFGASTEQAGEEQVDPRLLSMLLASENR